MAMILAAALAPLILLALACSESDSGGTPDGSAETPAASVATSATSATSAESSASAVAASAADSVGRSPARRDRDAPPIAPPIAPPVAGGEGARGQGERVAIAPGQSIQAAVDAHPPGTQFVIEAGTHRRQSVVPKPGNAFVGERGAILDGEHETEFAFHIGRSPPFPDGVTIRGLVIRHYAPPVQRCAVEAKIDTRRISTGWVIADNEVRDNATCGISAGRRTRVLRNNVHHNGQIGIKAAGDSALIEGNEIAFNNHRKAFAYGFEAGGTKFTNTRWLVVRNNHVHDNWGSGLWTDINNIHTLYEGNRVEDNAAQGIFHEISYDAVIRDNVVRRNGFDRPRSAAFYGAQILIAHSANVEVYGNTVETGATFGNGIMVIQQKRSDHPGPYGPHELRNVHVHDNTIIMRATGRTGIAQDVGDVTVFTRRNVRFERNSYHLGTNARPFAWMNGRVTAAEWRGAGQDAGGVFKP
jgi:hypothetical protein